MREKVLGENVELSTADAGRENGQKVVRKSKGFAFGSSADFGPFSGAYLACLLRTIATRDRLFLFIL